MHICKASALPNLADFSEERQVALQNTVYRLNVQSDVSQEGTMRIQNT